MSVEKIVAVKNPFILGHRGYKAKYVENTIPAIEAAKNSKVEGIEIDVQVSKDDVVVVCHDISPKRIFGYDAKIPDCNYYGELDKLHSIQAPHSQMPTLEQVLKLIISPEYDGIWLCIDVKPTNLPSVYDHLSRVIKKVNSDFSIWQKKLVIGVSKPSHLESYNNYLSTLPLMYIGFSLKCANLFLELDNLKYVSILIYSLYSNSGAKLIKKAREKNVKIYSWTVNDTPLLKWVQHNKLDGVVTDDPKNAEEVFKTDAKTWSVSELPYSLRFRYGFWSFIAEWFGEFLRVKLFGN